MRAGRYAGTLFSRSAVTALPALVIAVAVLPALGGAPAVGAQSGAAPVITSLGPFTVDEGTTVVASLTATDEDTGTENLTWSIPADSAGGLDRAQFSLTTEGALSFTAAKDFENPDDSGGDGVYDLTVQVSDGANTDTADLTVTLRNVAELLSAITGAAAVSHAENVASRVGTYSASSADDAGGVTWSLSGDDSADFEIAGGVLRFKRPPPDYESPGDADTDNGYAVTLQAAAGTSSVTLDVTVTVTDENEEGTVTFSSARPSIGTALIASVADPDSDSDHAESVTWTWERSRGRTGWAVIGGATSASYTPVAADSEHYLRASASYTDRLGSGRSASAVAPNPPLSHKLSALSITGSSRAMYPAFTPEVLHYAVECGDGDTMALTWSAAEAATRVAVDGVQRAGQSGSLSLTGLTGASDIVITLSGATGASTTYVIHCLDEDFPDVTTVKRTGATEGLIGFVRRFDAGQSRWFSHLMIIDNNGVPRYRERIANRVNHFRLHPGGAHPYSYSERDRDPNPPPTRDLHSLHVVLDAYLKEVARVWTVPPLRRTDNHDFTITPAGNYVLMSYEPRSRDFSGITDNAGNVLTDDQGQPYGTRTVRDSDIQIITPEGQQLSLWSSWDHMAIEDCTQHRFPDGYAHINSLQFYDGDVIAAFRGCSKVLRIDPETGTTVWRVGRSYRTSEQWTASGEPEPLTIVGDPYLEFCGLHSAKILGNGNLLLFDNGGHCVINPVTGTSMRESAKFARGVEYAIDTVNGEAIFQAHHSLHGQFAHYSLASGHIEAMDTGDWLISWGRALIDNDPNTGKPPDESATQVDPRTGTEKFSVTVTAPSSTPLADRERLAIRGYPMAPVALAPDVGALAGAFPASSHTSGTNPGAGGTARAVVAFSRPVVDADFTASTASLSVQGATIANVSAHVVAGEAANAYLVTLTPDGDGAITLSLVANAACASGGVCTADGTTLTRVPDPLVIGARPVAVTLPPIFIAPPPGPSPRLLAAEPEQGSIAVGGEVFVVLTVTDGAGRPVSGATVEAGTPDEVVGPSKDATKVVTTKDLAAVAPGLAGIGYSRDRNAAGAADRIPACGEDNSDSDPDTAGLQELFTSEGTNARGQCVVHVTAPEAAGTREAATRGVHTLHFRVAGATSVRAQASIEVAGSPASITTDAPAKVDPSSVTEITVSVYDDTGVPVGATSVEVRRVGGGGRIEDAGRGGSERTVDGQSTFTYIAPSATGTAEIVITTGTVSHRLELGIGDPPPVSVSAQSGLLIVQNATSIEDILGALACGDDAGTTVTLPGNNIYVVGAPAFVNTAFLSNVPFPVVLAAAYVACG